MEVKILTGKKEKYFLELAKEAAEKIVGQNGNEHIFENNLQNGFTSFDNCYISYNKQNEFTFLQCPQNNKFIFTFFRIMTENGKLTSAQQINIIDFEKGIIYELNHHVIVKK